MRCLDRYFHRQYARLYPGAFLCYTNHVKIFSGMFFFMCVQQQPWDSVDITRMVQTFIYVMSILWSVMYNSETDKHTYMYKDANWGKHDLAKITSYLPILFLFNLFFYRSAPAITVNPSTSLCPFVNARPRSSFSAKILAHAQLVYTIVYFLCVHKIGWALVYVCSGVLSGNDKWSYRAMYHHKHLFDISPWI